MFCPKCGTQNPETGKFCRSCGTDLSNISEALTGKSVAKPRHFGMIEPIQPLRFGTEDAKRRSDPNEVYADGIKGILSGTGFFIMSMILLFTGVANGRTWWWAMLFPAFIGLSKGISDYLKSKRMETSRIGYSSQPPAEFDQPKTNAGLPSSHADYVSPGETKYKTGDLVPPSVTDSTTKLLDLDSEGQTRALPKK